MGYADVSCYGRPDLSTPNIDRIAANGIRFLQAYANSAVCSATRTALITGRYQYRLRLGLE
jgi:arylsulfatase A-like enzyme